MSEKVVSIGINAYEANVAKRVGSNQYAYQLLCQLEELSRNPLSDSQYSDLNRRFEWTVYLPEAPLADMPKERPGYRYVVCPPKKMWTQWRLPLQLFLGGKKHDLFLSLGHYGPRFAPCKTAICVLDLAYLKFPQFFLPKDLYQLREWTKYSVKKAAHVFTISQASKLDIKDHYQKKDEDISIIYPGVAIPATRTVDSSVQSQTLTQFGLQPQKYIVSVGTIQPRKNMISAVHAFELLVKEESFDKEMKLVFVGKAGWMTQEFDQAIAQSTVKDRIVVTGFVEEAQKQALLQNAACSFLVGFYEGFGIPVVESLFHGVRPVVANTSSLPEVAGKFAQLIDPYDVTSIVKGFSNALKSPPDSMERAQMHDWAVQFSWANSATKMLNILISLVQ